MIKFRTIIAEDETYALELLKKYLAHFSEIDLIDTARSGTEALEKIGRLSPDLVFLDIQMPGMNGIELAEKLKQKNPGNMLSPVIVFVTAYDQYAIKAFENNATDYLVKPFDLERLEQTILKIKSYFDPENKLSLYQYFNTHLWQTLKEIQPPTYPDVLTIREGNRFILLRTDDITHVEANGNYVSIYTQQTRYLQSDTLTHMLSRLNPEKFRRIHRSAIVQISHIKEIRSHDTGDATIILHHGKTLKMSRNYRENLPYLK